MAHPLELSYNWRTPVAISTIALVTAVGFLASSGTNGWGTVALILGLLWAGLMVVVYLRTRAFMLIEGPILRVRRYRGIVELDGRRVSSVREYPTPSGPCYRVRLIGDDADHHVPSALLRKGHSTLFDWVLAWSPRAELDKGARRTVDQLRTRGLLQ